MVLPSSAALDGPRQLTEFRATGDAPDGLTPQRAQALERLEGRQGTIRELAEIAEVSDAVLRGLVNAGALEAVKVDADRPLDCPDPDFAPPELNPDQQAAAAALSASAIGGGFDPVLLDGVTGSGKTEVYFEAIAQCLRAGRQALVLLPEIALTEPFLKRFEARFGCAPVAWHSGLRSSQRRRAWRGIASGEAQVVVGARSALFLPYPRLGLIVVDEAHEPSFKQEDGVQYHARDAAVMRARFEDIPVILSSATPAIESKQMVAQGRYREVLLPSRFAGAQMPAMAAIDMTQDPPPRGRWLAPSLVAELEANLEAGEQSLLFLNRRGFAPLTLCRTCGHRFQCPNCTAWMVEHRLMHRLACHHCGHVMPPPAKCPECGDEDSLVACGPGVERIADEVADLFPEARVALVTSDTIWSPQRAAEFVAAMDEGAIDIVIGTQLVTKGYHFPNLTLVGVVDADLGLQGGDLRAAERSFQQISQVAGRAGRGDKPGRVLVQTHDPDNPVIAALVAGDAAGFYAAETEARRERRHAAVRPARRDRHQRRGQGRGRSRRAPHRPRRAAGRRHGGVRARPGPARHAPRPPPACASWSTPRAASTSRTSSATGWPGSNGAQRSASRSTSTLIASSEIASDMNWLRQSLDWRQNPEGTRACVSICVLPRSRRCSFRLPRRPPGTKLNRSISSSMPTSPRPACASSRPNSSGSTRPFAMREKWMILSSATAIA